MILLAWNGTDIVTGTATGIDAIVIEIGTEITIGIGTGIETGTGIEIRMATGTVIGTGTGTTKIDMISTTGMGKSRCYLRTDDLTNDCSVVAVADMTIGIGETAIVIEKGNTSELWLSQLSPIAARLILIAVMRGEETESDQNPRRSGDWSDHGLCHSDVMHHTLMNGRSWQGTIGPRVMELAPQLH